MSTYDDKQSRCFFIAVSVYSEPYVLHFTMLARELMKRGHRVIILALGAEHHRERVRQQLPDLHIASFPSKRATRLKDAVWLYRMVRQHKPDCMIANFSSKTVMLWVGWLLGVPCRITWLRTLRSGLDGDLTVRQMPAWEVALKRWRSRHTIRRATHIFANSHATKQDVHTLHNFALDRIHVTYHSLPDFFDGADPSNNANKRQQQVVCVGRLSPVKGQDVLLRAVALLTADFPELCVTFVGSGPSLDDLQALATDLNLTELCDFLGGVSHQQVMELFQSATIAVVPSRSEAFGLVNIEAMMAGTPVIASNVGGIPDIIRDGEDGLLFPTDDPAALAEKIRMLLLDVDLRERLGRAGRQRFLETFTHQQVIPDLADLLEALCKR